MAICYINQLVTSLYLLLCNNTQFSSFNAVFDDLPRILWSSDTIKEKLSSLKFEQRSEKALNSPCPSRPGPLHSTHRLSTVSLPPSSPQQHATAAYFPPYDGWADQLGCLTHSPMALRPAMHCMRVRASVCVRCALDQPSRSGRGVGLSVTRSAAPHVGTFKGRRVGAQRTISQGQMIDSARMEGAGGQAGVHRARRGGGRQKDEANFARPGSVTATSLARRTSRVGKSGCRKKDQAIHLLEIVRRPDGGGRWGRTSLCRNCRISMPRLVGVLGQS